MKNIGGIACLLFCVWTATGQAQEQPEVRYDGGHLVQSLHRVFDQDDRLAAVITFSYDTLGIVEQREISSYNPNGTLKARFQYSADEDLLFSEHLKYDRHGRLVKRDQRYYYMGEVERVTETRRYNTDCKGNLTRERYYLNGKLFHDYMYPRRE